MALPDISKEISSLTTEHHEENAKNICKLNSLENIYKTYFPDELPAADSGESIATQASRCTIVPPATKSTPAATLTAPKTTIILPKTKKTLRSFLHRKSNKLNAKLPRLRVRSGEMMSAMQYPPMDDPCDCVTPTNSNLRFDAQSASSYANSNNAFGSICDCNRETSTTGLYEQNLNLHSKGAESCNNSLCYCPSDQDSASDYEQQSYMEGYANSMQSSSDVSTQSFSHDSCCCHSDQESGQQDHYYEYQYTPDGNATQGQTFSQFSQIAQQIAQQVAEQFYQHQLCQQMGQQVGQQAPHPVGQPMAQPVSQSWCQPSAMPPPCQEAGGVSPPQMMAQSSYGNAECLGQQFPSCGGTPMPFCSCSGTNCLDIEGFFNKFQIGQGYNQRLQEGMINSCGSAGAGAGAGAGASAGQGAFDNQGAFANQGGYANDMLHAQTVYTTDYKPLNPCMGNPYSPQMMQLAANEGCGGMQQPSASFMNQYACDCALPGGFNMGNDFGCSQMSSMPTSCSYAMSSDTSQLTCESLDSQPGNAARFDCSGAAGHRPIGLCIMCAWYGICGPPCECQTVNGSYCPSRYQCALDEACMPDCCKPLSKQPKRNGLSCENLASTLTSYPNQRRSCSAEPRRCVCFDACCQANELKCAEEKFSNMVPPSFLCADNEKKKKQPKCDTKKCDCSAGTEANSDLLPINCFVSREGVESLCKLFKIGSTPCSCACCCHEESPSFLVLPMTTPSSNNRSGARAPAQAPQRTTVKPTGGKPASAAGCRPSKMSVKSRSSSVPASQCEGARCAGGKASAYEQYKEKSEQCYTNCCGPLASCACEPENCIDKVPTQLEVPNGDYDCKDGGQKVVCCLNFPGVCAVRNKGCVYPHGANVTITGAEPIDPPNDSLFDMKKNPKSSDCKGGDPSGGCDCGGQNTDCICTKGGGDDQKGWCCPWYMYGNIPVQPPRGNLYNYFRSTCCTHCWPCSNAAYTTLGQIQQRQEQQRQAFSLCKAPGNAYDQMVQNYEFYNKQQCGGSSDAKSADGSERMDGGSVAPPKPLAFPTIYTGNPMGLAHELYAPYMPWQQSCHCPGGGYVTIGNKLDANPFSKPSWLP